MRALRTVTLGGCVFVLPVGVPGPFSPNASGGRAPKSSPPTCGCRLFHESNWNRVEKDSTLACTVWFPSPHLYNTLRNSPVNLSVR